MVGVAAPVRTPIGARLEARGVRPRQVSAKRSWPPRCGRFPPVPEAGDGVKDAADGVIEGRVEEAEAAGHAVVSSAACSTDLLLQAETEGIAEEKTERGEADRATTGVSSPACNRSLPQALAVQTPIGARLAARGVRPRKVSAKRSWPPSCGRFPEAGDGEKGAATGIIEGRMEEAAGHAVVSSAACNGDLPPAPPQAETEGTVEEKEERAEADVATTAVSSGVLPQTQPVPPTEADVRLSNSPAESMAVEVTPPRSSAVAAAVNSFVEIGPELSPKGGLAREQDQTGNVGGGVREIRVDDGHDTASEKIRLISVVNPPPKRRAVSAVRKFPPGCGRSG